MIEGNIPKTKKIVRCSEVKNLVIYIYTTNPMYKKIFIKRRSFKIASIATLSLLL